MLPACGSVLLRDCIDHPIVDPPTPLQGDLHHMHQPHPDILAPLSTGVQHLSSPQEHRRSYIHWLQGKIALHRHLMMGITSIMNHKTININNNTDDNEATMLSSS